MDTVKIKAPFVIDAFGDLIFFDETIDYYPYGETRLDNKAGAFDERHKYTGYEFDATTGLNYAGVRYQTPLYGRFISQDPAFWKLDRLDVQLVDPQSWNSYAYARNNPVTLTDENGEFWMESAGAIASGGLSILITSTIKILKTAIKVSQEKQEIPQPSVSIQASATPQTSTPIASNLDIIGGEHLRSNIDAIKVTFDKGVDHAVSGKLSAYFKTLINNLVGTGIDSINISSTTRNWGTKSAHEHANGGRAFDVTFLNEQRVEVGDQWSSVFQNVVKNTVGYLENYGPAFAEKIIGGEAKDASGWARDTSDGKDGHYRHIHVSVDRDE
jgi:RHS repeat-associated protein